MTNRERFHKLMNFEPVDRLPVIEWATWWDKTIERWRSEGMPPVKRTDAGTTFGIADIFGHDMYIQRWIGFMKKTAPSPAYHGAPLIHTMTDYKTIKPHLYPDHVFGTEESKWLGHIAKLQQDGEAVFWMTVDGPFWGPRTLMGITEHLMGFYDEPELMHTINTDLARFNLRALDQLCEIITPDFMTFGEDMSYNLGPMVSEETFNEFMLPYYNMQIPVLKSRGIRVIIDSDGDITIAAPWFLRAGIEGILPLERQAGVDIAKLREAYPRLLIIGAFDKMTMARGEEAMRAEFERLLPVMRQGGFIPSVDHQTPPGVSYEQYLIFNSLLHEYSLKC